MSKNNLLVSIPFLFVTVFVAWVVFLSAAFGANETPSETELQTQYKAALFNQLLMADNEAAGRQAEDALWNFWFDQAPTPESRILLDAGIERREAYDFEAAENRFDELIDLAPDYSEGYNQRAFIRFLRENYSEAQVDLEKTLALEPNHFGALSGLYQILMIQNRQQAAFEFLRKAVQIHPWLKERSALPKSMRPDTDHLEPEQGVGI